MTSRSGRGLFPSPDRTAADYIRRHGPFEPHCLPTDEKECTMPELMEMHKGRWEDAR